MRSVTSLKIHSKPIRLKSPKKKGIFRYVDRTKSFSNKISHNFIRPGTIDLAATYIDEFVFGCNFAPKLLVQVLKHLNFALF